MALKRNHIIRNQYLHVNASAGVDGLELQREMKRVYYEKVLPLLGRLLDQYFPGEETVRIRTLELDLGGIQMGNIETEFPARVEAALRQRLTSVAAVQPRYGEVQAETENVGHSEHERADGEAIQMQRLSPTKAGLETLLHFLAHGILPWGVGEGATVRPAAVMHAHAQENPMRLAQLLADAQLGIPGWQRLFLQIQPRDYLPVMQALASMGEAAQAPAVEAVLRLRIARMVPNRKVFKSVISALPKGLASVLAEWSQAGSPLFAAGKEDFGVILQTVAATMDKSAKAQTALRTFESVQRMLEYAGFSAATYTEAWRAEVTQAILQDKAHGFQPIELAAHALQGYCKRMAIPLALLLDQMAQLPPALRMRNGWKKVQEVFKGIIKRDPTEANQPAMESHDPPIDLQPDKGQPDQMQDESIQTDQRRSDSPHANQSRNLERQANEQGKEEAFNKATQADDKRKHDFLSDQARDLEGQDNEVRDGEVLSNEVGDSEIRDGEVRDNEIRDGEVRDGEIRSDAQRADKLPADETSHTDTRYGDKDKQDPGNTETAQNPTHPAVPKESKSNPSTPVTSSDEEDGPSPESQEGDRPTRPPGAHPRDTGTPIRFGKSPQGSSPVSNRTNSKEPPELVLSRNGVRNKGNQWSAKPPWEQDLQIDYHIHNGGLILLWPYLPHYFRACELMEGDRFIGELQQERAVHLLQFIACGSVEAEPEDNLLFNKILCGLAPNAPIGVDFKASEKEIEEGEAMLRAVIQHWRALGDMSVSGFRGTWLLRKAGLGPKDSDWLLRMERSPWDLMLDFLPWGKGTIYLPWLNKVIHVEW